MERVNDPDSNHMIKYCRDVLPGQLTKVCGVDADLAGRIGEDVIQRAEAFAALSSRERDGLIAPFVE
ncbi:hypothetical protein ACQP00_37655 [Dactylosporangium sp. CS-047395]|uniref:hypothetical protein n=1 Tax=Dactylosporangium sp. CS-047395 TaxID=3239936 RepID=UPI003D90B7A1